VTALTRRAYTLAFTRLGKPDEATRQRLCEIRAIISGTHA
jgi:hypothetical protein